MRVIRGCWPPVLLRKCSPASLAQRSPTTRVVYSPDDRLRLEAILKDLPAELFKADDALGWVYQFWQSKRKDEVNKAGNKIGGADISPVTQLFTEHYMVRFLLENSLGAWWAGRHPDSPLLREWEYLRFRDDGTPAAGTFEGWPTRAAEITVMDPCMGSGHFLVAAADMLRRMRMEEEGLAVEAAAEAVLADNLFGLELDPRCTQLGAFALAFDAWKAAGGYRRLPVPNIACSGIAVKGQLDDWRRLAGSDTQLRAALERLYEMFQDAPELGSLIDPRSAAGEGLWAVDSDKLLATLDQALSREAAEDPAAAVFGAAAQGTAKAARFLASRYWLVATNPPFLGRGQMSDVLRGCVESSPIGHNPNLATAFLVRCGALSDESATVVVVLPHAWWSQDTYAVVRRDLISKMWWSLSARLGAGAFTAISGEVVNVVLQVLVNHPPAKDARMHGIEAQTGRSPLAKADMLIKVEPTPMPQLSVLQDRRARVLFGLAGAHAGRLGDVATALQGTTTGDNDRWIRQAWEVAPGGDWRRMQTSVDRTIAYGGRSACVRWSKGGPGWDVNRAALKGATAFEYQGVAVRRSGDLPATLYSGDVFDMSCSVLLPNTPEELLPIWAFCSSSALSRLVRQIDSGWIISNGVYADVPFDLEHWTKVAAEQYPNGLPEPHSDDPTQWVFKGNIVGSEAPLQVAVARLLGYRWPDQEPDVLDDLTDPDGIVCLPPVSGEAPAAERLEQLLAAAYGTDWSSAKRIELLAAGGGKATTLEAWLRDEFFEQHARLFYNSPFIWQVWDGSRNGFSALLHYHRLDRETLEKLTYAHLGEWLERQRLGVSAGEVGADLRLKAAGDLKTKLAAILEGEPPFDIYVRWKSLAEQPIGWEPDLNDGVRLNIRPFVTAGILRSKLNIKWGKDPGKNPDGSERLNERIPPYAIAEKRTAREGRA